MQNADWLKLLSEKPDDFLAKLAYADWLEENKLPHVKAYRFMGEHKLYPSKHTSTGWEASHFGFPATIFQWYPPYFKPKGPYSIPFDILFGKIAEKEYTLESREYKIQTGIPFFYPVSFSSEQLAILALSESLEYLD